MILYLDSSALVKAYVQEIFSSHIREMINSVEIVASAMITYVEIHSAFARLNRENKIDESQHVSIKKLFLDDWQNYLQIESTSPIIKSAGEFSEVFGLRAYDSLQLASASMLLKQSKQSVIFACFDNKLNQAAHVLGLDLLSIDI